MNCISVWEVVLNLSDKDVIPRTCNSFVNCRLNTDTSMVESVGITLDLVTTVGHEVGSSGSLLSNFISPIMVINLIDIEFTYGSC